MGEDITKLDLYKLLGIPATSTTQEVKKAYRKKALTCHPDKNPDNPKAAELFHQLSKALEILIDEAARAAYDKVLNGKIAAQRRNRDLDARRKKLKEDLEAREREAQESAQRQHSYDARTDEEKLQAEIDRLRKEGSKQLEAEVEYVRRQVHREWNLHSEPLNEHSSQFRLKVKWKVNKDEEDNGGYNHEVLHRILSKYGTISVLVVSAKKKGTALVEFERKDAAELAHDVERGLAHNPLSLEWIGEAPKKRGEGPKLDDLTSASNIFPSMNSNQGDKSASFPCFNSAPNCSSGPSSVSDSDFESLVLRRMRQAQERKRLEEDIIAGEKN